ncbi:MAG: hypothetical protein QNJ65_09665 [Xenococcaceae cyanobacterium MO_234.B1]|nr:hypothetical protein [Xenococcaceae cyanobacterium MO_234.B1]
MNQKFRDIVAKYELTEEIGTKVLAELKIGNPNKNPSKIQLQGFESVCNLLKQGVEFNSAISQVIESALKQSLSESSQETDTHLPEESPMPSSDPVKVTQPQAVELKNIDSIIEQQAEKAAAQALSSLPNLGQAEYDRIKESFILKFREHFIKKLLGSNFQQDFGKYIDAQVARHEQGKLRYIESLQTSLVSEPETSGLLPGK